MKFGLITIAFSLFVATQVSCAAIPGIHQRKHVYYKKDQLLTSLLQSVIKIWSVQKTYIVVPRVTRCMVPVKILNTSNKICNYFLLSSSTDYIKKKKMRSFNYPFLNMGKGIPSAIHDNVTSMVRIHPSDVILLACHHYFTSERMIRVTLLGGMACH